MKNTSLLCLSSPEGDANYYSALMNMKKDNGDDFFQVINCFQICKSCLKLDRAKQILCSHVKSTAHWLSSGKIKELKQLYKASPEDAIREFGGVVVSDYKPALRKEEVERCFSAATVATTHAPPYIFTTCDPNGGGPSQMSIASGYFTPLGHVVVSRDHWSCDARSASHDQVRPSRCINHIPHDMLCIQLIVMPLLGGHDHPV